MITNTAKRPLQSADLFVSPFEPLESRTLLSMTPALEVRISLPLPVAFHPGVISTSASQTSTADCDDATSMQTSMARHGGLPTPQNFGALSLGNVSGGIVEQTTMIFIRPDGGMTELTETHLIGSHPFGGGGYRHYAPGPGHMNPGMETPGYRDEAGTNTTPSAPMPISGGNDAVSAPISETPHGKKSSSAQGNDVVTTPASNSSAATATNFTALSLASTSAPKTTSVRVRGGETTATATIAGSSFIAKAAKAARAGLAATVIDSADGSSRVKVPGGGAAALFSSMLIRTGQNIAQAAAKAVADAPGAIAAEAAKLAGSWVTDAATSIEREFHFQQMGNPMVLIGDALAAFTEESTQAIRGQVAQASYVRAWGITATVVAIDAIALVYYWQTNKARRLRRQATWATAALLS